ncbi:MAG: NUDIX hydrolase [Bacteriovorax sp.]
MKSKTKVLAYIFRTQNNIQEILVFSHRNFPEAGLQVAGGTVDPGEDLIGALLREIKEESGLSFTAHNIKRKLGETRYQRKDIAEINHRHYFEIDTEGLPDSWAHTVHSTGADNGLVFDYFWLEVFKARSELTGQMGELLPKNP